MSTPTQTRKLPEPALPRRRHPAPNKAVDAARPGNRVHLFRIGAALVPLAAVGFLLLNDHLVVADATTESTESDKSVELAHPTVSTAGNSSINNNEVTTQLAESNPVPEQLSGYSPDDELISSYENQIQELRSENDGLLNDLEESMDEADDLREETLHLNEELLRLELALLKANEAAKGLVDTKTVYNITNVPVGGFVPKGERSTESIDRASNAAAVTGDDETQNHVDPLGSSGELEIEVSYEDASPADQLAYDEYINDLGYTISYTEFRFSDKYKPADAK